MRQSFVMKIKRIKKIKGKKVPKFSFVDVFY